MATVHVRNSMLLFSVSCVLFFTCGGQGGNDRNDKVLLQSLSAITLHHGAMTAGRRSSPVPQLTCVGGTAGCHAPQPKVIQCYNRGWDGYDVQWECISETDIKYQLGRIEVTCEGYDYPDDPYILRDSCGLEYELDLTEQGQNASSKGFGVWSFLGLVVMISLIFAFLVMFPSGSHHSSGSYRGVWRKVPKSGRSSGGSRSRSHKTSGFGGTRRR